MGRSKPRTNKRPPPKPNRRGSPSTSSSAPPALHFDPTTSLFPPPSTLDPSDPNFPSAFQSWSTSALHQLNQLGQLPRLTPSQLSAIAGAAAGVSDAGLAAASHAAGHGPCIDLPQSLAALFEAKLTLDREKAKLMRMQKELSGYQNGREGAAIAGPAPAGAPPPLPTVKGKEVAPVLVAEEDDLAECTCGRNGHAHEYPGSAHSGSDDYYYYDTEDECCECCSHDHSYVECDHEPGECDCEEYEEEDHHHHHHHHHHDGEVDSDADEYEYADDSHGHGHGHGHGHDHGHGGHAHSHAVAHSHSGHGHAHGHHAHGHSHCGHSHDHAPPPERAGFEALVLGPDGRPANLTAEQAMALFGDPLARGGPVRGRPPSGYLNSPEARAILARHAAKQQEVAAAKQQLTGRIEYIDERTERNGHRGGEVPRRRLADDPERMDEAVRELFNWIKAVVWTIEQAALVTERQGEPPRPQRSAPGDPVTHEL